jgi:FAD-dependent urate hydroxylase
MNDCDVAIIGAGPYGLSAAAHLRALGDLHVRVFGEPMSFWSSSMPAGMLLRSNWTATQIASPNDGLTLEAFQADRHSSIATPVPVENFIEYGLWYQSQAVPDVDRRRVSKITRTPKGFRLTVEDGEFIDSHRVVIAGGIAPFRRRPPQFEGLPQELATHTSEHREFTWLAGKDVLVVGSGQSGLESAALLHEAGARVSVIGRSRRIHWLQGWASSTLHRRLGRTMRRLLYAPTDVGPAGLSQLLARPHLLRRLPRKIQDKLRRRAVRPAGARWLVERLRDVPITLDSAVASATPVGDRVQVHLTNGSDIIVDHVLLATGFQIDISKYDFLDPNLLRQIDRANGFPLLQEGLETSVTGLHFLGAPAAYSFGPLLQFVSGTRFASHSLVRAVVNSKASI